MDAQHIDEQLIALTDRLSGQVSGLVFSRDDITIYNPLEYARKPQEAYIRSYGSGKKRVVFLGMNPGPWGMAQTGVPFGEVSAVRDWMRIEESVGKPRNEHPKRPILGFHTPRSEVSGKRLWGLMRERYGTPERFFQDHFVLNYCPLVFMEPSGKNLTPDKLPKEDRCRLEAVCDEFLSEVIRILDPEILVGIGKYAEKKLCTLIKRMDYPEDSAPKVTWVLHPSPASPTANRGWAEAATKQLIERGVWTG